jgi:ribosome silencing factor RsfS/YbeB/iojap
MAQTTPRTDTLTSDELLTRVIASLEDDKAEDIVQIDLRGKTAMADWMIVASGRSSRQVASISEKLVDRLKQEPWRAVQGRRQGYRRLGSDRHGRHHRPRLSPGSARFLPA